MTFEEWWNTPFGWVKEVSVKTCANKAWEAGAVSRDAEILQLQKLADEVHAARKVNAEHDRLLVKIAVKDVEIAELVEALEAVIPEVAGGNAGLIAYNKYKAALAKVRKP